MLTDDATQPAVRQTNKGGKHITVLPTIWLDGSISKPMIMTKSVKPLPDGELEIPLARYSFDSTWINAVVCIFFLSIGAAPPHQLFREYLEKIFLKEVRERRKLHKESPDETYYLIMDNYPVHRTREVLSLLCENHVKPIFLPECSSAISQPLDCAFNANMKTDFSKMEKTASTVWPHLSRPQRRLAMACRSVHKQNKFTVMASFRNAGICASWWKRKPHARVNLERFQLPAAPTTPLAARRE